MPIVSDPMGDNDSGSVIGRNGWLRHGSASEGVPEWEWETANPQAQRHGLMLPLTWHGQAPLSQSLPPSNLTVDGA
jgi:hypothetical protein